MSKLDELIKELCPNGVEYKTLGEVTILSAGGDVPKENFSKVITEKYCIPIYSNGIGENALYGYTDKAKIASRCVTIAARGTIGYCVLRTTPFFPIIRLICAIPKDIIIADYLKYVIDTIKFQVPTTGIPQLTVPMVAKYKIPVPPLEIQREIVRILDCFTLLTTELTTELTVRKKQYNYYRDMLLSFDNTIKKVKLKDIAVDIYRGAGIKREEVTETGIPCVRYGEIYTTYNTWFDTCVSHTKLEYVSNPKYFGHGDILFAITGESVEDIAKSVAYIGNEKCLAGGDIVVLKHNQEPRYLAHVLSTYEARQQKSKGKIKSKVVHSSVPAIEEIEIPLPPMEVQKRYADVLDNFEKICNDLNIGLPAEIEARKKQYEYYRDVLLAFAESGSTIIDRQSIIRLIQYVFGYAVVKLDEIATITRGGNFQKKDFMENGVPCIHYGQIYTGYGVYADKTLQHVSEETAKKSKKAVTNDIIMAVTSENVEDVCKCVAWLGKEDIAVSGHTAIIHHNQNAKYLAYYFHTSHFEAQKRKLAHGTKVIEVTPDKLGDLFIPLPTKEEQDRIVEMLDRFDTLCSDISEGLPAEIEVRQKQYEYYRDKLLNFKELSE